MDDSVQGIGLFLDKSGGGGLPVLSAGMDFRK